MWQAAVLVRCAQSGRVTARHAQYRLRRQCVYTVVMVTVESVKKNVRTICVKFVFGETKSPKAQ